MNVSPPPMPALATNSWSACPVEEGVVEAGRGGGGGGVAPGAVLAGLAAGLQHQEVPLASLLSSRHLERLRADGGSTSATVDNLWAATLAGEAYKYWTQPNCILIWPGQPAGGSSSAGLVLCLLSKL